VVVVGVGVGVVVAVGVVVGVGFGFAPNSRRVIVTETESVGHVAEVSRALRAYAGPVEHGAMAVTVHGWADTLDASVRALRQCGGDARWYCVSNFGGATLCVDERDARHNAEENDGLYPADAPHVATQLVAITPAPTAKDEQT
jgi:hypothetical protein